MRPDVVANDISLVGDGLYFGGRCFLGGRQSRRWRDIRSLQGSIKVKRKSGKQHEIAKACDQILAIAKIVGVLVSDMVSSSVRAKSRPLAVH